MINETYSYRLGWCPSGKLKLLIRKNIYDSEISFFEVEYSYDVSNFNDIRTKERPHAIEKIDFSKKELIEICEKAEFETKVNLKLESITYCGPLIHAI